jgi:hypothetical protein
VGLNILQTGATGVGVELFNNRSELDRIYATKISNNYLATKEAEVIQLSEFDDPIYQTVKEKCDSGEAKLNSLPANHPLRDNIHVKLFGTFAQKDNKWQQVSFQQLPICRQVTRLEDKQNQRIQSASEKYRTLFSNRTEIGSDIKFLQTFAPDVFQQHFNNNGEIKSGPILVGLATTQVYSKLFNNQWSELGLSLFMFALSGITSIAACVMALCHALSKDVQRSYDPDLQKEIDNYFQGLRIALMAYHQTSTSIFTPSNPLIQSLEETYEHDSYENDSFGTIDTFESLPAADEKDWDN